MAKDSIGIFCIEPEWHDKGFCSQRNATPVLSALKCKGIGLRHVTVNSPESFFEELDRWLVGQWAVLYIFSHGDSGEIFIGDEAIDLLEIANHISRRGRGRHVHFGACETFDLSPRRLLTFLDEGALASCSGYSCEVDTSEAVALEILFFDRMTQAMAALGTKRSALEAGGALPKELVRRLGFQVVV